jgi:hypothetical protein
MATSQFFRVAVEGDTTDGRKIEAQWIKDIVKPTIRKTYTALVNCEHVNGLSPDGQFGSYGHVAAVKAEPVQLNIGGKSVSRLALYAQIEANDNLVASTAPSRSCSVRLRSNPISPTPERRIFWAPP